jgi:signal transduction histidine kinase
MRKNLPVCLLLAFCWLVSSVLHSQPEYARQLWNAYQTAPDFDAQKKAFQKLERFYRFYHLDSNLILCNDFKKIALEKQPDYAPFVDLRIAGTLTRQLEFEKAGNMLIPLLEKAEREKNDSLRAGVLLNLSNLNKAQKQAAPALQRALEAAAINERLKNWRDLCSDYSAIASVYIILPVKEDSALFYHQKALEIAEREQLFDVIGTLNNNIGVYYHLKNDFEKATSYYKEAVRYYRQYDDRYGLCFTLLNIGHVYRYQKQWKNAIPWYDDAMPVCESCGNIEGVASIHMGMTHVHEGLGDYKAALEAQRMLAKTDEKLNAQVYNRTTQTLEARYGAEKKERELTEQRAQNFRQQVALYALAASLLAFAVFARLFYHRYRLRKKAELDAAIIREQKMGLNAVIEAQEAERKRIARDLHDGIAQELVAFKLGFDALGRRMVKIAPDETTRFADLGDQLNTTCTEVRSIAHVMSPPVLEQQGLAPGLELLLRHTLLNAGVEARLNTRDLPARLDEKTAVGLYRIAQELLNNIVKHARAANVVVELFQKEQSLVLRVEDDGVGYNFEEARARGSMGLLNILSRAAALGGEFLAEKRTPKGTIARVSVPLSL